MIETRFLNEKDIATLNIFLSAYDTAMDFQFGWSNDDIREMTTEEAQSYWFGAFIDNKLVAICSIGEDEEECEVNIISDVYVIPEARKNNVGFTLVKEAIKNCFGREIHIQVLENRLMYFYEKFGFVFDEEGFNGTLTIERN